MSVCIFSHVKLMGRQLGKLWILCLSDASSCEVIIAVCLVFTASAGVLDETGDEDVKSQSGALAPDVTEVTFVEGTEDYI